MDSLQDFGGTFRTRSPEQTLRDLGPYPKSIGITRVANVTGLDTVGIPVWMAVRPLSRSLTVSQGKGADHAAARVSAAMELVELYHAEHFVPAGEIHTLKTALASEAFANPLVLPLRKDAVFKESRDLRWIEARSVTEEQPLFVPREIVDRDSRVCQPKDNLFFSSSNGLASGNTLSEALIHGLCEAIERDQMTFWMITKELDDSARGTLLDVATIDDAGCGVLVDQLRAAGLEVAIWYASTTTGIPCFTCTIWDEAAATLYPQRASGAGCHPYKKIALSRAITEAAQSRLTYISGARDDMYWAKFRDLLPVHAGNNRAFLLRLRSEPREVCYGDIPEAPSIADPDEMVLWICGVLERDFGSHPVYVDLSQQDAPVSVVHVLCPSLEVRAKKALYTPGARAMAILEKVLPA